MIQFVFDNIALNVKKIRNVDQLYVDVESDFTILVDGKPLYSESGFVTIELANDLAAWMALPSHSRPDFEFESLSTDEIGWVWIRRRNDCWQIGSIRQNFFGPDDLSNVDLEAAITDFIQKLILAMKKQHNVNITKFLPNLKAYHHRHHWLYSLIPITPKNCPGPH
jgi:hypothetical protein